MSYDRSMKGTIINIKMATALGAVAILLFGTSCTKEENTTSGVPAQQDAEVRALTDRGTQDRLKEYAERIPAISWYNSTMDKIITLDPKNESKSFNFSDPNPGWNYSDNSETTWVPAEGGGGILFIGPGSFGSNTGSGLVVAGSTTLNVNYTFCFAASDEALGLDIGGFGGPEFDGISGVVGIAGDFEALMNGNFEDEADIYEYFYGLAYYVVYDNEASGSYDILNWFDSFEEEPDDLGGNGFAWVYAFSSESWELYFSQNGQLNVSGGSMNFNGSYFGLIIDFDDLFYGDDDDDVFGFEFVEASGYGAMGCN